MKVNGQEREKKERKKKKEEKRKGDSKNSSDWYDVTLCATLHYDSFVTNKQNSEYTTKQLDSGQTLFVKQFFVQLDDNLEIFASLRNDSIVMIFVYVHTIIDK